MSTLEDVEEQRARQALSIVRELERASADFSIFSPTEPGGRWRARLAPGDGYVSGENLADCLAQLAQSVAL